MENPTFIDLQTIEVSVHGMTCQSCVKNITLSMKDKEGIIDIQVSLENELAVVKFDPVRVTQEQIIEHINEMGFDAELKLDIEKDKTLDEEIKVLLLSIRNISNEQSIKMSSEMKSKSGILSCDIYQNNELAAVSYKQNLINPEKITQLVKDYGIDVTVMSKNNLRNDEQIATTILHIEGMTCDSCTNSIKTALNKMSGVKDVSVSLKGKKATVKHIPSEIKREEVRDAIDDIGFDATVLEEGKLHYISCCSPTSFQRVSVVVNMRLDLNKYPWDQLPNFGNFHRNN